MLSWFEAASAAFQLLVVMTIAWVAVFLVSRVAERRLRRSGPGGRAGGTGALSWLWNNSNPIGIGTLLAGAAYLIWAMNWGPGLASGPTALVIMLMTLGGFLIGFAPIIPGRRR